MHRPHPPHSRLDGFALPMALLAMMVIGVVVTVGFYVAARKGRPAVRSDLSAEAFYVAQYGLEETLAEWRNPQLQAVAIEQRFEPARVAASSGAAGGEYDIHVRRIGAQLFMVTSTGRVDADGRTASRRVATMVRTLDPRLPAPSAVTTLGAIVLGDGAAVRGDAIADATCRPAGAATAAEEGSEVVDPAGVGERPAAGEGAEDGTGVVTLDPGSVDEASLARITGSPPLARIGALDTAALDTFGDFTRRDLVALATREYEAGASERNMAPVSRLDRRSGVARCDADVRSNWGDPTGRGPCAHELPIIHARGDLDLHGGRGQGVLIVDGDLRASDGFTFYGVVVVRGSLELTGPESEIRGSVIVEGEGGSEGDATVALRGARIAYSTCRVARAFDAATRPRPLAGRSWMDLTTTGPGRLPARVSGRSG